MAQDDRLNSESEFGLWLVEGEAGDDGFVVFADGEHRCAFLLSNYDGRPAYTCMSLTHVNIEAKFAGPVILKPLESISFEWATASLGQLIVRDGEGLLTTLNRSGQPVNVLIAPYGGKYEASAEYGYNWMLSSASDKTEVDEAFDYYGTSTQSWLNAWQSPHYVDDFEDDEDDDGECPSDTQTSLIH